MLLPKSIQNHEAHSQCVICIFVHHLSVTDHAAIRDRRIATQLTVYQRSALRPQTKPGDRVLWSWIARHWSGWRNALVFVQSRTVIAWQRKRFRDHWAKLSKHGRPGRPPVPKEIRALIRKMSKDNVGWGSLRIVGELRKSASMSLNQPWRSTGCDPGSHRLRRGRIF